MKLFAKYSRINVLATIVIFLCASIAFYFTLRFVFINQIDEDLRIEEKEIEAYVKEHNQLPESISVNDQFINYQQVAAAVPRSFATNLIKDGHEDEKFRQLQFSVRAAGNWYAATVSKSLEETENLTRSVLIIALATILLILLASFIINRVVLKRIWRPFYQSLQMVSAFRIGSNQPLSLPESNIDEFELMNASLAQLTKQVQKEYEALKTFSENASHEMQTPLAVIRSRLDLMIQDEALTESQSAALQTVYNSVQKLTRLNQSLLLLAKIGNNQFHETKPIDLKKKIEEKIADFKELWHSQKITVQAQLADVIIDMNPDLLDLLLNNLLSNATRHNVANGKINIALTPNEMTIANTSTAPALPAHSLYHRFSKPSNGGDGTGLGLSIIKEIVDASGFRISYQCNGQHVFRICWN